ncbi:MAG: peptidoglycan-binding protein [Cyanobacteria bacterium P01_A01_bin.84]
MESLDKKVLLSTFSTESEDCQQFTEYITKPTVKKHIDLNFPTDLNWKQLSITTAKSAIFTGLTLLSLNIDTGEALAQIRRGTRGAQVRKIQRCLKRLGHFNGPVNGNFGPQTENAVRRFQGQVGLRQFGFVGPKTDAALNRRCGNYRASIPTTTPINCNSLRYGCNGAAVRRLQRNLQRLGYYNGPITNNFRELTRNAVIRFQRANSISPIGVVGPQTRNAIQRGLRAGIDRKNVRQPSRQVPGQRCDPNIQPLSPGCNGIWVRRLQEDLQRLRYSTNGIDGYYGRSTQNAVMTFQQNNNLEMTGIADFQTLDRIRRRINADGQGGRFPNTNPILPSVNPAPISPIPDPIRNTRRNNNFDTLYEGVSNNRVKQVQLRLKELGFFRNAEATSYYGPLTRSAVGAYQQFYDLPVTGNVDEATWRKLGLKADSSSKGYAVVVPVTKPDTIVEVRQYYPEAFVDRSPRGDYVNVGKFSNVNDARKVSDYLRDRNLDARVEYL